MEQKANPFITGPDGNQQNCRMQQKSNNGLGQMIYVFINEVSGDTYTIVKSKEKWTFVNGQHPENCARELGEFIDQQDI